jgi:hypothetical protein
MSSPLYNKCLFLYLGCETNKGKFVGIRNNTVFIETSEKQTEEYAVDTIGITLFFFLRKISDLTSEQSKQLIKEGFTIGRPHGYTFSNHGFLYLLSLNVDLFGLIKSGHAKDIGPGSMNV